MYIQNTYLRTAYRSLTAVFLTWGILLHFSCTDGDTTAHNFSFFTVQSNLLCLICVLLLLRQDFRRIRTIRADPSVQSSVSDSSPHSFNANSTAVSFDSDPTADRFDHASTLGGFHADPEPPYLPAFHELKFTATLCILVTFLCNHAVVLFSRTFTGGVLGLPMKSFLAHYVAPALITLDWLLFTPKGRLHAYSPLRWMLAPAFYLLFTALRALCCEEEVLTRTGKYPYFFLNVDLVGARVYIYIGIYFACFLAVGYLIFFTDLILGRIHRREHEYIAAK
ncbi:MAG: Pr6Pr family membrane protein [Lachnospiraceae bacterium]|nr:Pr6Pr family membrane protein [Lachnospiraceae bacterium]